MLRESGEPLEGDRSLGVELRNQSSFGVPTVFCETEGHIMSDIKRESRVNPAQSETPGMSGNSMRENRETQVASRQNNAGPAGESDEQ